MGLPNHLIFVILFPGHYVVICGYDADTKEFEIRDPASARYHPLLHNERLCMNTVLNMEK